MNNDLCTLFARQESTRRRKAEWENASARMELAQQDERMAYLLSQREPVAALGLDRERLRLALSYIKHGDLSRLDREFLALRQSQA